MQASQLYPLIEASCRRVLKAVQQLFAYLSNVYINTVIVTIVFQEQLSWHTLLDAYVTAEWSY